MLLGLNKIIWYFYGMRKIHKCFIRYQLFNWNLFDPQNKMAWFQLLYFVNNFCSSLLILCIWEYSFFWWLNNKFNIRILLNDLLNVTRSQWRPSFPYTFIFRTYANIVCGLHLNAQICKWNLYYKSLNIV